MKEKSKQHRLEEQIRMLTRENARLSSQQDLLESLYENISIGITVWGSDGALLHINKGFTALTGYTQKEIRHLNDWFPKAYPDPDYRERVLADWSDSTQKKDAIREFQITCKNGEKKEIEFGFREL